MFFALIVGLQLLAAMLPSLVQLAGTLIQLILAAIGGILKFLFEILGYFLEYVFKLIGLVFTGVWDIIVDFFSLIFNFKYAAPIMLYPVRLLLAVISIQGFVALFPKVKANIIRIPLMIIAFIWLVNILDPTDGIASTFIVKYIWQLIFGFCALYYGPKLFLKIRSYVQ